MYFCLFISILSTLMYFNILIAEIYNGKFNYIDNTPEYNKECYKRSVIKTVLLIIMSLFWACVLRYSIYE